MLNVNNWLFKHYLLFVKNSVVNTSATKLQRKLQKKHSSISSKYDLDSIK